MTGRRTARLAAVLESGGTRRGLREIEDPNAGKVRKLEEWKEERMKDEG